MDRVKPNLPVTVAQDLRQWGSTRLMRSALAGNTVKTECARVALEEPRNVQVTVIYSEPYDTNQNDTRVRVSFGVGTCSTTVEVREGVHIFPCQNLQAVAERLDPWNMITAHPDNNVTVYCTLTDEPPSWVAYDEVP